MGMGLCPTRASRAWEPRYEFHILKLRNEEINLEIPLFQSMKFIYYINSNEIPGELSCENITSSHVKIISVVMVT